MNAPLRHWAIEADADLPWSTRWQQARGTFSEKRVLLSIAAEARDRDHNVWCASFDAATTTDPDERAEHIAELERLFEEAAAAEDFAERCWAYEQRTGRDWDTSASLWAEDDDMRPVRSVFGMGAGR